MMLPVELKAGARTAVHAVPPWARAWILGFVCTGVRLDTIEALSIKVAADEHLTISPIPVAVLVDAAQIILPVARAHYGGVVVVLRSRIDQSIEFGVLFSECTEPAR
jgi:hypothetical protein